MVTVENLSKTFGTDTEVLKDINLNIKKNEIVAILGPSGTGKSTLLRCLNFLCIPTTGIIQIGNARVDAARYTSKEVRNLRRQSAMVFQGYNLFKNKTALENVMEALVTVHNRPKAEAEETSLRLLEKVGMLDRKDFYPAKMSGGQPFSVSPFSNAILFTTGNFTVKSAPVTCKIATVNTGSKFQLTAEAAMEGFA